METVKAERSLADIYLDWLYTCPVDELIGPEREPLKPGGGEGAAFAEGGEVYEEPN